MTSLRDETRSRADPGAIGRKHTALNGSARHHRRGKPSSRIIRASEILVPVADEPEKDASEIAPGVESFQEALRLFPPFRDEDASRLDAVDVQCPDCDAVFSSPDELQQHYLTKYCPGAAVAIYIMTRDRLITKGYRMEKRFIPLQCRSLRIFCDACNRTFALDGEVVPRQKDAPLLVECVYCGKACDISYEPSLSDSYDDSSIRDLQSDVINGNRNRSSTISQKPFASSKLPVVQCVDEDQSLAKKAKRIRDSWSFRKLAQNDEDELVAISFSGLNDLERVHAPNGAFQQLGIRGGEPPASHLSFGADENDQDNMPVTDLKDKTPSPENKPTRTVLGVSNGNLLEGNGSRKSFGRKPSLFQKIFGRKATKGPSRPNSTTHEGKRLVKRSNSVRFSMVSRSPSSSRTITAMSEGKLDDMQTEETAQSPHNMGLNIHPDLQHDTSSGGNQNPFIHMQILPGGTIVHDASGRQRILNMDEISQLFSQLKDDLTAAAAWGKIVTTRLRAESALRSGNLKSAIVDFNDALKWLEDTPALDVERISRAAMLFSLAQAYRENEMAAESEACYLESLGLYKRSFGRDNFRNFSILQDLGMLCEKDGYPREAAELYERAFAGRLKTLGNNDPDTLNSMQDLASLKISLGDFESALVLLEKAVPSLEAVFGLHCEKTLNAMDKLSLLYHRLGHDEDAHAICGKAIQPCKASFGINESITMDLIGRYLQTSDNFDFSADITEIVDQYRHSQDPEALRVVHRLGRAYMDAGLSRDAAQIFQSLFEDFLTVKGADSAETFDAISALCVSFEHLDDIDNAIHSYRQLVHMAEKTPEDHHSRRRVTYAEKRIRELSRRRSILTAEKRDWGLLEAGQCVNCGYFTTVLCSTCKTARFCSEACHKLALPTHQPHCVPSVSLRESKSLAVKPICPESSQHEAIARIPYTPNDNGRTVNVTANYTFSLDPRNFSTFRMKFSSTANTIILFTLDLDIKYTTTLSDTATTTAAAVQTPVSSTSSVPPKDQNWVTPSTKDSIIHIADPENPNPAYLIVAPGRDMLDMLVEKRVAVRQGGGEGDRFRKLEFPNEELIQYAQGLLLSGYSDAPFMYVIEWEWK